MPSDRLSGFSSAFDELLERSRRELDALSGGSGAPALSPTSRVSSGSSAGTPATATRSVARGRNDPSAGGAARGTLAGGARARRKARPGLALRDSGSGPRGWGIDRAVPGHCTGAWCEPHLARLGSVVRSPRRRRVGDDRHGRKRAFQPGRECRCSDVRPDPGRTGDRTPSNRIGAGRLRAAALDSVRCDSMLTEIQHDHARRNRGSHQAAQPDRRGRADTSADHDYRRARKCRASCRR